MQTDKKKILIIDDSMLTLKLMKDILTDTYEVVVSQSGEEGVRLAESEKPHLVLLDIEMSGMNGFQVLKALKENPVTEPIPVIFLTGYVDSQYEERGLMEGAVDYIVKPYNINIVKARVKTHVTLYSYRRQIEQELNIDTLTEVYNRRAMKKYLEDVSPKIVEQGLRFNVIVVDIDYFKQVNDTYGHSQGDFVLQSVAAILRRCVKTRGGFIARYGGEEFVVVVQERTREEMEVLLENICRCVREAEIENKNSEVYPYVTVSVGGAGSDRVTREKMHELVTYADNMMYKSKEAGRNCYHWYEAE